MPSLPLSYDNIRTNVIDGSHEAESSRVEVNQRALIDKILARYASEGAVYRELLQNSNDAEASEAEIYFTVQHTGNAASGSNAAAALVTQVVYRNNGMPFRGQDWDRLRKIAEGNPDVAKIGAFGVGAYTIFSISEEPLVVSGNSALAFVWKGDALWTKTAPNDKGKQDKWTSFVLPSRDPYPLTNMRSFGEFLAASLTFTGHLHTVRVYVNDQERMEIKKKVVQPPRPVKIAKSTSWFKQDGAVTSSSRGTFSLGKSGSDGDSGVYESVYELSVRLNKNVATTRARYVSAKAKTRIPSDMAKRMVRVTKKQPPKTVQVQLFLNAEHSTKKPSNDAERITQSFAPQSGSGRIFIGFRTSQTTGLAAHLAAPFVPTVEREAMDLQDPTLRIFNTELLEFSGILMRLTLEHAMTVIDGDWKKNAAEREKLEQEYRDKGKAATSAKKEEAKRTEEIVDDEESTAAGEESSVSSSGFMGFARFMAKRAKKKIVQVVNEVVAGDDGAELLRPPDPRPLCLEERQAITLMQSFCPQQSTPDAHIGATLALGFSRCMSDSTPPVLARSGVVSGSEARLPNNGLETFVEHNVVRSVLFENAQEYHTVIAQCRRLSLDDLIASVSASVLEEEKTVTLLKWWTKYSRVEPSCIRTGGPALKDSVRFYYPASSPSPPPTANSKEADKPRPALSLADFLFYVEKDSLLSDRTLPMPDTVLPWELVDRIGLSTLMDASMSLWFNPLPIEIWVDFIGAHPAMTAGQPEDELLRVKILSVLNSSFSRRYPSEKVVFADFCKSVLADKRCIPFDSDEPTSYAAERPADLYVYSAELKAFEGVGSFYKASQSLKSADISEEFLLCLGVRKSISIDFLFENLDTLKWSKDPRPLVEYLRSATLTQEDVSKLSRTRYLPAENDDSRTFAPSELYLPDLELRLFPFVKMLQWPSESEIPERSPNGKFLVKLGMQVLPPLGLVLTFLSNEVKDDEKLRIHCLDFVCNRLGPHGPYNALYTRSSYIERKKYRILPCVVRSALESPGKEVKELHSPVTCYTEESCAIMSFPVIDPKLGKNGKLYGNLLQCAPEPSASSLIHQLSHLVALAKKLQTRDSSPEVVRRIKSTMGGIFKYMSHRSNELDASMINGLKREYFIPIEVDGKLEWLKPDLVFFRPTDGATDETTELLFHVTDFSPFLSTVGVRPSASTEDIFQLMLSDPDEILRRLGGSEAKYRALLRRIAADPPFSRVTPQIRNAPFLIAYSTKDKKEGSDEEIFHLRRSSEVFIIDNSVLGRMFSVDRAPHESDLEEFYHKLGASYISKSVDRRFEVAGSPFASALSRRLKERIMERAPLLVSPAVTSRPLRKNAETILNDCSVLQAQHLLAVFSFQGKVRRSRTSCVSKQLSRKEHAIYVVADYDGFDVGYAVGDLILQRCQLEDAFFISSLLEAPLDQLRARGFPVDRILKPKVDLPKPVNKSQVVHPAPTVAALPPPATATAAAQNQETVHPAPTGAPPLPPSSVSSPKPPPSASGPTKNDAQSDAKEPEDSAGICAGAQDPNRPVAGTGDESGTERSDSDGAGVEQGMSLDGFHQILKQMYPDVDEAYLRAALGDDPSLEDVRRLAEEMSSGNYPRDETVSDTGTAATAASSAQGSDNNSPSPKKSKSGLRKKLGRAIRPFRGGSSSAAASGTSNIPSADLGEASASGGGIAAPGSGIRQENQNPVSPAADAQSQQRMEDVLANTIASTSQVSKRGVHSDDTKLQSIPDGLDRGETCEVIPGQSLKPFQGPRNNGKTHNGVRVFSSRNHSSSEQFLNENQAAVESFGLVLERLCSVYDLKVESIAIFHDPSGGTIAFNSNRALHFNIRFFYALHYVQQKHLSPECYSYWFVTFAHELAHHIVSAHNKEHGFYTESITAMYLPKLLSFLQNVA